LSKNIKIDEVVLSELASPRRAQLGEGSTYWLAALKLDLVPLAIPKANRFDVIETRQCPGKTCRRILTA
jgi:hypothetical protein